MCKYRPDSVSYTHLDVYKRQRYACDYKVEELVSERINMVLWITLMDCVKQEILRSRETGVRKTYRMIKEICNHSYVKEVIRNMNTDGFHMKPVSYTHLNCGIIKKKQTDI